MACVLTNRRAAIVVHFGQFFWACFPQVERTTTRTRSIQGHDCCICSSRVGHFNECKPAPTRALPACYENLFQIVSLHLMAGDSGLNDNLGRVMRDVKCT
jgi:hypothetical protein